MSRVRIDKLMEQAAGLALDAHHALVLTDGGDLQARLDQAEVLLEGAKRAVCWAQFVKLCPKGLRDRRRKGRRS